MGGILKFGDLGECGWVVFHNFGSGCGVCVCVGRGANGDFCDLGGDGGGGVNRNFEGKHLYFRRILIRQHQKPQNFARLLRSNLYLTLFSPFPRKPLFSSIENTFSSSQQKHVWHLQARFKVFRSLRATESSLGMFKHRFKSSCSLRSCSAKFLWNFRSRKAEIGTNFDNLWNHVGVEENGPRDFEKIGLSHGHIRLVFWKHLWKCCRSAFPLLWSRPKSVQNFMRKPNLSSTRLIGAT